MKLEKIISRKDNLELELAIIEPKEEPKAIIQISHGMAEHKERYYEFMKYLTENGYICVIHDHRGHGESIKESEDLGYFYSENINYIVDDLEQVTEYIKEKYPNLEIVLFSHSMGTLVARNYLKKYDNKINKIILCGPPTENKLSSLGLILAKLLKPFYKEKTPNNLLNKMTFGNYNKNLSIENEWICSNIDTVTNYNKDKLCGFIFKTNGFVNLYKLMKQAFNNKDWKVQNKDLKIFIIAGKEDPVIQNTNKFKKLVEFIKNCGYNKVSYKLYDKMRHEILNETNNKIVYKDILDFIEK